MPRRSHSSRKKHSSRSSSEEGRSRRRRSSSRSSSEEESPRRKRSSTKKRESSRRRSSSQSKRSSSTKKVSSKRRSSRKSSKVCAFRASQKYPSVYTKEELVRKAKRQDPSQTLTYFRKMAKADLCELLDIEWMSGGASKKRASTAKKIKDLDMWGSRPCKARRTKANPSAFNKDELVDLAMEELGLTHSQADKHTKSQLCRLLNDAGVRVPKFRGAAPPSRKPKKKDSKRKKESPKRKKKAPRHKRRAEEPKKKRRSKTEKHKKKEPKKSRKRRGDCKSRTDLEFRPHQLRIDEYLVDQDHRGVILNHATGSGKTLTAVLTSQCLLDKHPDWNILILALPSLKDNFRKEMAKYGLDPQDSRYTILGHQEFANRWTDGSVKCNSKTFLIIDEAHELRTDIHGEYKKTYQNKKKEYKQKLEQYRSGRLKTKPRPPSIPKAAAVLECAAASGKVLLLTATSIFNHPSDIENLVAMVKGTTDVLHGDKKRKKYERLLSRADYEPGIIDDEFGCIFSFYENPKNIEDFPKVEEHIIREIMPQEVYEEYYKIERQIKREVGYNPANPRTFLNGLRQATNAIEPCVKCYVALNLIQEGEKTLLFSHWKDRGINIMKEMMDEEGIKYLEISGDVTVKQRQPIVDKFNNPKGPNVLIITKAGGTGLDLKGVRKVIFLDKGWNTAEEEQVEGRADRYKSHAHLPKKERKVDVYHLLLVKPATKIPGDDMESADEYLYNLSRGKDKANKDFENYLRSVSIENKVC
jgi:hypothetical protein